jgi:hypothetical protein
MNEFYQDVAEKKRIANGARHRVVRSKTKYVGLKNYSAAERRKLNGEAIMYTIEERHTYKEIKKWPADLRAKHFDYLANECGMNAEEMSRCLDCAKTTLYRKKEAGEIATAPRYHVRTPEQKENYLRIMGLTKPVVEEETVVEALAPAPIAAPAVPEDGNLTFYGEFSKAFEAAQLLLGAGRGKLVISWRAHKEEGIDNE